MAKNSTKFMSLHGVFVPGEKGVYESKCQRPTKLKIVLYLYCSMFIVRTYAYTSVYV